MSVEHVETEFEDLCTIEDGNSGGRIDKRKHYIDKDEEDKRFKSKNLDAERRRRKKLSDRQLELRSLVPIITNMNKATIITDAITYIEELQKSVKDLSDQLIHMEKAGVKEENEKSEEIDATREIKNWEIITRPEVQVINIDGRKLWIKMVFQKKERGGLTKLMEAINLLGFDLRDTSITTSKGAVLVTSFVEGIHGGLPNAGQIKELLIEIIQTI